MAFKDYPHNTHCRLAKILLRTNKFGHPHWEDEMMCNYAHGPSISNHLNSPTTIFQKVKPFAHVK